MNKCKRLILLSIMMFICIIGNMANGYAENKVITIRADAWPPYNDNPQSATPGFMIEIVKAIFIKEGYTIDYQLTPWSRSLKEVEEGKIDAVIGATTECPDCVTPKEAIGFMDNHFYVKKGNKWRYTGPNSLKNVSVGVIAGYTYSPVFDSYIESNKSNPKKVDVVFGEDPLQINIKKIMTGHLDTFIENPLVVSWVLQKDLKLNSWLSKKNLKLNEGDIEDAGTLENSRMPVFIKFSGKIKTSKTYADTFDKGITGLRKSGELKKILNKYNIKDWK